MNENAYCLNVKDLAKKIANWADERARGYLESLMPELEKQYISKAEALRMGERMTQRTAVDPGGHDVLAIPANKLIWTPKADVAPVVHAEWVMKDVSGEMKAVCTHCGKPNKQYTPPYCPHCGAKMEEKS